MNSALISIIVPCYNQAEFLDECLQSVLEQTYQNWECIIVNDGSPDNTEEVAKKWLDKDVRFKYLDKENGGLSSARNAGIEKAKNDWILPLDADDKIAEKYLELAVDEFEKGFTIIYCEANFFGSNSGKWNIQPYSYQRILTGNMIFCSAFFKKSDWKKVNGYDENLKSGREDWEFWLSILSENKTVKKLDYEGFFYRRKEDSMDVQINKERTILNNTENTIYQKHVSIYRLFNKENSVKDYEIVSEKIMQLQNIEKNINKNILTKILFKIIKRLN